MRRPGISEHDCDVGEMDILTETNVDGFPFHKRIPIISKRLSLPLNFFYRNESNIAFISDVSHRVRLLLRVVARIQSRLEASSEIHTIYPW